MAETPTLQREQFKEEMKLISAKINASQCQKFMKTLQGYVLDRPKIKPIVASGDGENDKRLILLNEKVIDEELKGLPQELAEFVKANCISIQWYTLVLDYSYFGADEILAKILPEGTVIPTSFEIIGHIAHMNLREPHMPYRYVIGEVILDKNPRIKTVVNKVGKIETQFRTFQMEVLAGENNLDTQVKENNCTFAFNFGEVYWNSRLQFEHTRLLKFFKKDDVICDMFAGVGPFAIPVFANDLNPKSFEYLVQNAKSNKVQKKVYCYNLDARVFMERLLLGTIDISTDVNTKEADVEPLTKKSRVELPYFTQVVMNLPASAVEFLDVFRKMGKYFSDRPLPWIHCYGFSNSPTDPKKDIVMQIEQVLGVEIQPKEVHEVRDVSPHKIMLCVSFQLPKKITVDS